MRHGLKIRNDIPGYMAELRRWLQATEVDGLEEMAAFFSARLDCYEDHMSRWQEAYRHMASLVPPDARTLLDLGCGTGLELDALLPLRPDLAVTGVDLSPDMLMRLRLKHPGVQTHCADYFAWELGQARYDAALTLKRCTILRQKKRPRFFLKSTPRFTRAAFTFRPIILPAAPRRKRCCTKSAAQNAFVTTSLPASLYISIRR